MEHVSTFLYFISLNNTFQVVYFDLYWQNVWFTALPTVLNLISEPKLKIKTYIEIRDSTYEEC